MYAYICVFMCLLTKCTRRPSHHGVARRSLVASAVAMHLRLQRRTINHKRKHNNNNSSSKDFDNIEQQVECSSRLYSRNFPEMNTGRIHRKKRKITLMKATKRNWNYNSSNNNNKRFIGEESDDSNVIGRHKKERWRHQAVKTPSNRVKRAQAP